MSTPATPLRTLPPDFFSAPGATGSQLRPLPPDFFEGNDGVKGTGSPTVDSALGVLHGIWEGLSSIPGGILHPVNTGEAIYNASKEQHDKAVEAYKSGDVEGAVQHAVGMFPVAGPVLSDTLDSIADPKVSNYDAANKLGNTVALHLVPKLVDLAGQAGGYVAGEVNRPNVATDAPKAFNASPNQSDFAQKFDSARSDVKTYGGGPTPKPYLAKNPNQYANYDFAPTELNPKSGTDTAINVLQGGMDKWVDRAESSGIKISGDHIVQSVKDSIPSRLWQEDPTYAQGLVDRAKAAYGGQQFTPTQFRDFLRTGNASDSPFYNKLQTAQGTASTAGSPQAIDAAITNGIRGQLYPALDPDNNGAGPREIQDRTGALMEVRNQAEKQHIAVSKQKPGTVTDVAPTILKGAANLVTGGLLDKLSSTSLMHPLIGPNDALIARLMKYAPDADPIPLPDGEYPAEQGPQNRYYDPRPNRLGAAPMEMMPQQRQLGAPSSVPVGTRPSNYAPGTPQTTVRDSSGNVIPVEGGLYNDLTRRNLEPEVDTTGYGTKLIEATPKGTITKFPNPPNNSNEFIDSRTGEILDTTPASTQPRQFNAPAQGRSGLRVGTQSGGSRVASPTGQEVSPTQHFENPLVNPDMVSQLKYGKKYQSLSPAERDYVDGVVSGRAEIKLSDILRK